MFRPISFIILALLTVVGLFLMTGCRAAECRQMSQCCSAVQNMDGVGPACKGLADGTKDPTTCRAVLRTIGYMLEDQDEPLPDSCRQ